jgi:DNA-binding transcriptional regulator GbsR (MarR family)
MPSVAKPEAEALSEFVEEAGQAYGTLGLPRMAGRVLGYLLVCDPPYQTQPDLARELQASKGSISTMVRILEQIGAVKRITRPGERREYVTIPEGSAGEQLTDGLRKTAIVRKLAAQGVRLLRHAPPERSRRVRELEDLYQFLDTEMPRLMARWDARLASAKKAERQALSKKRSPKKS